MIPSRRRAIGALSRTLCAATLASLAACRRVGAPAGACGALDGGTVRSIVPNAAGGGYDTESRMLEPALERRLGVEIAIQNLPGAGGIVGAAAIAAARPDGRTMGIIGVPGLLLAGLLGQAAVPNPATAFTMLGRVGRSWHVWAAGATSSLRSMADVMAAATSRPLVFGINEAGSANFASIAVTAHLLGLPVQLVAGLGGTRGVSMAALRGDVDLVCFDFETMRDLIEGGDLRPILQVSQTPVSRHPALAGVPVLGGADGLLSRRTRADGFDPARAATQAAALFDVMGAGRTAVCPAALEARTSACLADAVYRTLLDPDVTRGAARPIDPAPGAEALVAVRQAAASAPLIVEPLRDALRNMRQ